MALQPVLRQEQPIITYPNPAAINEYVPEWVKELKTRIDSHFKQNKAKMILFTGSSHKAGCSSIIAGFCSFLVRDLNRRVLLFDINYLKPTLENYFEFSRHIGYENIFRNDFKEFTQKGNNSDARISVISCNCVKAELMQFLSSKNSIKVFEVLKNNFDYILIDSPPINKFAETRLISNYADGVILILEAGKTRKQVAIKAIKEIESAGGEFIGTILNRRKFYIPNWIYRWL
jgi:Mrp family chromosome partitioning ATPase